VHFAIKLSRVRRRRRDTFTALADKHVRVAVREGVIFFDNLAVSPRPFVTRGAMQNVSSVFLPFCCQHRQHLCRLRALISVNDYGRQQNEELKVQYN